MRKREPGKGHQGRPAGTAEGAEGPEKHVKTPSLAGLSRYDRAVGYPGPPWEAFNCRAGEKLGRGAVAGTAGGGNGIS